MARTTGPKRISRTKRSKRKHGKKRSMKRSYVRARANAKFADNVLKVTCRYSQDVAPSQTLLSGANYLHYWLQGPPGGWEYVYETPEWQSFSYMFDRWRIAGMKVTLTPAGNVRDQLIQAEAIGNGSMTAGIPIMYSVVDSDGQAPISNLSNETTVRMWQTYNTFRKHKTTKTVQRKLKYKYDSNQWFDCQSKPGNSDVNKEFGHFQSVNFYGFNFPEKTGEVSNAPVFRADIEYYLVFKDPMLADVSEIAPGEGVTVRPVPENIGGGIHG